MSTASKITVYSDDTEAWRLVEADALLTLANFLPDDCLDAVVTDPPYALALGRAEWDSFGDDELPPPEAFERWTARWAAECRRVLKPGGHLLAFGAPRTFHRLVAGVEDAGLDVRDQLLWMFAQGLPKSRRLGEGQGTSLKPCYEPILLARKPLDGKTLDNIGMHGTGALNIDATRVGEATYWPAHVAMTHAGACVEGFCAADCPAGMIDRASPKTQASRLFFCAKATRAEREAGCEQLPRQEVALYTGKRHSPRLVRNPHPTVKPLELMRWLVRLVTPPGGLVLDPFTGSGSTGVAAVLEGRQFLGIEREAEYVDIACARMTHWAHRVERESV
jgi:site-specific DNA-methyltransferase (adenine-specific)